MSIASVSTRKPLALTCSTGARRERQHEIQVVDHQVEDHATSVPRHAAQRA
jgi:hypothetical protein